MSDTVSILVYSHSSETRAQIIGAVGERLSANLPRIQWHEAATGEIARDELLTGDYPIAVLDGEATKVSGMVVAKTLHEEMSEPPAVIITVARPQDEWLATWSGADHIVTLPLDPVAIQGAIIEEVRALSRS